MLYQHLEGDRLGALSDHRAFVYATSPPIFSVQTFVLTDVKTEKRDPPSSSSSPGKPVVWVQLLVAFHGPSYPSFHRRGNFFMVVLAKSPQSCPTLWDPVDCSLPGSSVHGILQARTLEWGCPPPGDLPDPGIEPLSFVSPALAGGFSIARPHGKPIISSWVSSHSCNKNSIFLSTACIRDLSRYGPFVLIWVCQRIKRREVIKLVTSRENILSPPAAAWGHSVSSSCHIKALHSPNSAMLWLITSSREFVNYGSMWFMSFLASIQFFLGGEGGTADFTEPVSLHLGESVFPTLLYGYV